MRPAATPSVRPALDPRAQTAQLIIEPLVAALDMLDAIDARAPLRAQRREDVRRAGANVWHHQIGGVQRRWPAHDAAMQEVALAEAALQLAEALFIQPRVAAHAV